MAPMGNSSSCDTPAKAKAIITGGTAYKNMEKSLWENARDAFGQAGYQHPGCDTRTNAAEDTELVPMRSALIQHAAAQNPPWTL